MSKRRCWESGERAGVSAGGDDAAPGSWLILCSTSRSSRVAGEGGNVGEVGAGGEGGEVGGRLDTSEA